MIIIITTFPSNPKKIKEFIYGLIGSKLVKCVNKISYVKSTFIWEGKIKSEKEVILIIKAKKENKEKVIKYIESKHPYNVPEILSFEAKEVNKKYLDWIHS